MTVTAQPRVPRGVPSGGEFTAFGHSEAPLSLATPPQVQTRTFEDLMADRLNDVQEIDAARAAMRDASASGSLGDNATVIEQLADDDRLVRLAVDRLVVAEQSAPGSHDPAAAGSALARYLMELEAEELADAVYAPNDEDIL